MLRLILIFCVAVAHGTSVPGLVPRLQLSVNERIFGGLPIKIADAPYQVSVQTLNKHICGGSIISEIHVLTAAQCSVIESNVNNLLVGAGSEYLNAVTKHKVARNTFNPKYSDYSKDYDVAVLRLAEKLTLGPSVAVVTLATEEPVEEEAVTVSGWGALWTGYDETNELYGADVSIFNRKMCEMTYVFLNKVTARMICAGRQEVFNNSCKGDTGGPMVSKKTKKQVGIVSWGYPCGKRGFPGVHTNVADKGIQEFIEAQLKL